MAERRKRIGPGSKRFHKREVGGLREDGKKNLYPHQLLKLYKNINKDPSAARSLLSNLEGRGYYIDDVMPLVMIKSSWDRGVRGIAEGVSMNIIPGDMGEYQKDRPENLTMTLPKVDLPLVGEVGGKIDPWFQGGKLLGSMGGQAALFKVGRKYLQKPVTKALRGLVKDKVPGWSPTSALSPTLAQQKIPLLGSKANLRRLMGRTGGFLGRNVPEGVVGGVAQGIREGDFDAVLPAAMQWYVLGLTGDVISTQLVRTLRNAKRRKERGEPQDEEELLGGVRIAEEVEAQISRDQRHAQHEDFGLTPERGFDPQSSYTGKVIVPAEESWILSPNGEPLKIGEKLPKYPGVLLNEKDALDYHAKIPHTGTFEAGDFLPLNTEDVLGSTRLGLARGNFYKGLDLVEEADAPKPILSESVPVLSGPTLFHGTGLREKAFIVKPDGSLELRASENFGGRQIGVSTTSDIKSAVDYAERVKAGGPDAKRPGVVFEIEADAFPSKRMEKEAFDETFFKGYKEITIPAGKWIERWKTPLRSNLEDIKDLSDQKLFERHAKINVLIEGLQREESYWQGRLRENETSIIRRRARIEEGDYSSALDIDRPKLRQDFDAEEADAIATEIIRRNKGPEFSGKWNSWIESPPEGVDPYDALRVTKLSDTPQGPSSLPEGERFFMHLGGAGEGKAEVRDIYRSSIMGVLIRVEDKSLTPDVAMQTLHGELRRLQQDPELSDFMTVPGKELFGLHIENFHYELLKAVENRKVSANEAIATIERAMFNRESPKPILKDLKLRSPDREDLIQEGSLSLIKAVDRIDWETIKISEDKEKTLKSF